MTYKKVLTIAGSDSGGGAGIQADLKTFSALGCFGTSTITAITAQNTLGVTAIHPIPTEIVEAQLEAVLSDIGADAIKIGMLHSVEIIEIVAQIIQKYHLKNIVLDPVMIATSGDKLIQDEAILAICQRLMPLATIVTPNLPEAQVLANNSTDNQNITKELIIEMGKIIHQLGAKYILIKGGHWTEYTTDLNQSTDILFDGQTCEMLQSSRISTKNTHGTGCTLSSAIASFLAHGESPKLAIQKAKEYITSAIFYAKDKALGKGHGAVHHFFEFWK